MCETCATLREKVRAAQIAGDQEKTRVMAVLLNNHWKHHHTAKHNVVAVAADQVIWPDGTRWFVRG